MKIIKFPSALLILWFLLCSCGAGAQQQPPTGQEEAKEKVGQTEAKEQKAKEPRAAIDPNKFAIVVAGVGGEEAYKKKFTGQATKLREAMAERLGFDEKHIFLLTEAEEGGPENDLRENFARSTAKEVRKAFDALKSMVNQESLVLVVLIGHGSFDAQEAKFNLIGPDLTAKDYAGLIKTIPSRRVIFINCASSSGEFVKPLSGGDRIVITATRSGNEQNATVFAEHFVASLTDDGADTDKNGRISVLEAFNYATKLTADWYKQQNRLATEHALIDDNGDGKGHEEATEGDGVLAKTTYLDSKPIEQAGTDAELARLLGERQKLEEAIEKLKARKGEMKPDEYDSELERLLVELAKLNQDIKARQKN